jgi:hypothetical protein
VTCIARFLLSDFSKGELYLSRSFPWFPNFAQVLSRESRTHLYDFEKRILRDQIGAGGERLRGVRLLLFPKEEDS